ncbi:hypothetical protein DEU56DRAFT_249886 [Suillus clintonianus]|uniref:uncharacterized protein n=1 Tax=Suillus clintonianus TaxID=1904413 RepID=UPI001B86D21E|nr:uncharacterized protein DEU56DRAFT_249886 [Suillus clintonianus]KAG2110093.1 hypothetical protein DEU56DRAFT_249886 [Suillus clintonianus]
MSDADSIKSTRSAPPSYDTALQHLIPEEEEAEEDPRVLMVAPLAVLAPSTNLSSDTLTARNYAANVTERGPFSSDAEATGPFTFSPFGPNTMVLLPHALSLSSRPLYHISVSSDCFRPQIFTTTIRRGTEQGQVIAEIQRSILQDDGYLGTVEYTGSTEPKMAYLEDIHIQRGKREKGQYIWRFDKEMPLLWQTSFLGKTVLSVLCTRYGTAVKDPPILATFHPSKQKGQLQTLDITTEGRPYMDDIVVSCLVTEGIRSTKCGR